MNLSLQCDGLATPVRLRVDYYSKLGNLICALVVGSLPTFCSTGPRAEMFIKQCYEF